MICDMWVTPVDASGQRLAPAHRCAFEAADQFIPGEPGVAPSVTLLRFTTFSGIVRVLGVSTMPKGAMVVVVPLDAAQPMSMVDTLSIAAGCLKIPAAVIRAIMHSTAVSTAYSYTNWMEDKRNTPIHPQEIWDAAFLAGSQFTRTLLTGEPND